MTNSPLTTQIDPFGIWHIGLFWGLLVVLGALIFKKSPPWLPLEAKLLWFWVQANALLTLEFPSFSYGPDHTAYMAQAGQTMVEGLLIPLAVIYFPAGVRKIIPWLVAFELFAIFFAPQGRGLMHQRSFDMAFVALSLPYLGWWLTLPLVIAFFRFHGSTALAIFLAYDGVVIWRRWKIGFLALLPLVYLPFLHASGPLLDGSERLATWGRHMGAWAQNWSNILFGVGSGSYLWSSLTIDKYQAPRFLSMHNDWLQVAFESGLVGLILALMVFWRALKAESYLQKGAVIGAALFGCTYHPLRFFPSALVVALIFRDALVNQTKIDNATNSTSTAPQGKNRYPDIRGFLEWVKYAISRARRNHDLAHFGSGGATSGGDANLHGGSTGVICNNPLQGSGGLREQHDIGRIADIVDRKISVEGDRARGDSKSSGSSNQGHEG